MRRRVVLDEVHRVQVDGSVMRVGMVGVAPAPAHVMPLVAGMNPDTVGAGFQVSLHLVVVVQVEEPKFKDGN